MALVWRSSRRKAPGAVGCHTHTAPNPYEDPRCQETDSPSERIFPFLPLGFRLSVVRLWQRVLSSFPLAGAPTGLHQTLIEVRSSR